MNLMMSLIYDLAGASFGRTDKVKVDYTMFTAVAVFTIVDKGDTCIIFGHIYELLTRHLKLSKLNRIVFCCLSCKVTELNVEVCFVCLNINGYSHTNH